MHRVESILFVDQDQGEWINSDQLQPGDEVRSPDGTWVQVLQIEYLEAGAKVYNFEVEQNHDYFVGSEGILVHNQTTCPPIFMEEALELGAKHVGPINEMEPSGSNGFQFRSTSQNSSNQLVQKIARFDVNPDPLNTHVSPGGVYRPHLNLQTQINTKTVKTGPLADPHIPIDPSTIRPGDYP